MNRLEKNPYTGTTPTEGMSDKERKTYIRRKIIAEFSNRHLPITIHGDKIAEYGTFKQSDLAAVWFDLHEEYTTDAEALYWIDWHFGKDSTDATERLRYNIYRYVMAISENRFNRSEKVRERFMDIMKDYTIIHDVCIHCIF